MGCDVVGWRRLRVEQRWWCERGQTALVSRYLVPRMMSLALKLVLGGDLAVIHENVNRRVYGFRVG